MSKRESETLERVHLTLFASDMLWLRQKYGDNQLGISKAVRTIIRVNIKRMEEKMAAAKTPIHIEEEDFPDLPEEEAISE